MATTDALFPVDDRDNSTTGQPLSANPVQPLFAADEPRTAVVGKLLFDPSVANPLFTEDHQQPNSVLSATPLFAPDEDPAPAVKTDIRPAALFDQNEPAIAPQPSCPEPPVLFDPNEADTAPAVRTTPEIKAAFEVPTDPLVDQVMTRILAEYPDRATEERALRNKMTGLFPMDFDKITDFAESALLKQRAFVAEAKRVLDLHQSLNIQDQMAEIIRAAQDTQKSNTSGSLLSKLRQEVVSRTTHVSGSAQWHATLHRLRGSLKLISGEIPAILSAGQESLKEIAQYAVILKALVPAIQDASINDAGARRLTLILGALQQVQIAIKQVEQAQALLRTEIQQVDETITVTLPALGFTI